MANEKMKILILLPRASNTSIVRLCQELSICLSENFFECQIIFLNDFIGKNLFRPFRLINILLDCNVLITTGALSDIFSAFLFPFNSKPRVISYIHCFQWLDLLYDKSIVLALPYYLLWRFSLYFKTHIVCVSHSILKNFPSILRTKSSVIYNHTNLSAMNICAKSSRDLVLSDLTSWSAKSRQLGYLSIYSFGFFVKRKNIQFLINYLSFNIHSCLVLIGSGPLLSSYKHLAEHLNVHDRILFIPFIENPSSLSSLFDVYISPSLSEGFGLANVEAAQSGITTVVPDLDVNLEVLSCFPGVYFYNNNSLSSLHRVINNIDFSKIQRSSPEKFTKVIYNRSWLSLVSSYGKNV